MAGLLIVTADYGSYPFRRFYGVLVFPDPDYSPPGFCELAIRVSITFLISFDLCGPEVGICFRWTEVRWTTVPKTSIHKYGDLQPREHEIRCPTQLGKWTSVHSVTETECVDGRPEGEFGPGVTIAVSPHHRPDRVRAGP